MTHINAIKLKFGLLPINKEAYDISKLDQIKVAPRYRIVKKEEKESNEKNFVGVNL